MKHILAIALSLSTAAGIFCAGAVKPAFRDASLPLEQRVEDALSRMTTEEKIGIIHAQSKFCSKGVPRLGIPELWTTDGPHGIRPEVLWDEWEQAGWTYVLPQSLPLIYTGQEIGYDHRFAFFEKDPVPAWEPNEWSEFYKRLNALRHANPALAGGERGGEMTYMGGAVADVMAFTRTAGDNKVVCLFNLSGSPQAVIPTVEVGGDFIDAMTGEPHPIVPGEEFSLGPWEYLILINN